MKKFVHILALSVLASAACTNAVSDERESAFSIDNTRVMTMARQLLAQDDSLFYPDAWVLASVEADTCALWFDSHGLKSSADTLMAYLHTVKSEGINTDMYPVEALQQRIDSVRAWEASGRYDQLTDSMAALMESALTRALVRYAYGQRYGYVTPDDVYRKLIANGWAPQVKQRELFSIPVEAPTDSLARLLIACVRADSLSDVLRDAQPNTPVHAMLQQRYLQALADSDTAMAQKASVNLERTRWRYPRPDSAYVFVNLAAQELRAVDLGRDSCLEMRICCGSLYHRSPMLISQITHFELNPYWVVPISIVRNEYATRHEGDSSYYRRNRMEAIDHSTGQAVDPAKLTAQQLNSGRYTLRQGKGAGNSLGRIVFRFPNAYSVFLHDTNSPSAFSREQRTVSHGCIRVQRPLDLATFLLGPDPDSLYVDRIRVSIDKPAISAVGKRQAAASKLNRADLPSPMPLWIDYYTLYPNFHGELIEYNDIYNYDKGLAAALEPFKAQATKDK